jgi:ferredoxin
MGKKTEKDKVYRLADDRGGLTFMLKTGKKGTLLTLFTDEEGNTMERAIRHCPNQRSIYLDEQSQHAKVEPIIFTHGTLEVGKNKVLTQTFLDNHPDNVANGGAWFEHVDFEIEAVEEVKVDELIMDIKYAARQKAKEEGGIAQLEAVVAVLLGSFALAIEMTPEGLKREIYNAAETNPHQFADEAGNCNIFEDSRSTRKHFVLRALHDGIIQTSPNGKTMIWTKGKKTIFSAPVGLELIESFVDFLETEEGMLVAQQIQKLS